jgi:hypothetical protein
MKLKSFGCSFIYGSELRDTHGGRSLVWPSKKTWPALLAAHHNVDYQSFARPGVGNTYIAEQILNECAVIEPAIFVVNWTYIDRFDYFNVDSWATVLPGQGDLKSNLYYQNFHSEHCDKFATLSMIKLCADTMLQRNIKFVMTYTDKLMFDTQWHTSPAIELLQNYIKPYCTNFNNKNFVQYAQDIGHPTTSAGHLLESGHQACFDYAKTHLLKEL